MEESVRDGNKSYEELLLETYKEHGESNPFYVRRSKQTPHFLELFDQRIKTLQEADLVKIEPYVPRWLNHTEKERIPNTQQKTDPDVTVVRLLPKGEELVKSRTTITRTETIIQETLQEPEEPAWKVKKRQHDFGRTERGCTIMMMSERPEALASDVRSHIQAIRGGNIPHKDMKSHQMWLRHELGRCWDQIPPELRHEAEDCRDLPITKRRKKN
jgi:hypothetical protein